MSNAIIFDWDGTIVSCEEKIDLVINELCLEYSGVSEKYQSAILTNKKSPGWSRNGFLVSLVEDYFTHRFGLMAEILVETQGVNIDTAWLIILRMFKALYLKARAKVIIDQQKLLELSNYAILYIVSNSDNSNILIEAEILGFEKSILSFIGDAKKYGVESINSSIIGISTARMKYREILTTIREKHENLVVIGDNFCLDLVTPISLGISTAYVFNPLCPDKIKQYIKDKNIPSGTINDILDIIITKMKGA